MSMTRSTIESAKVQALAFIEACDAALARLDRDLVPRWSGEAARPPSPSDFSYGSKETGTLRRRSMELTRQLAELRRRP